MQEDLYIYQQPFMLQEVKNLDRKKKILPTDIKVSDLQENQLDLN